MIYCSIHIETIVSLWNIKHREGTDGETFLFVTLKNDLH